MMTCKDIVEMMMDYLEGELPKEYCDLICAHVRLCQPCLHCLESYQVTIKICRKLPPMALPQRLIDRVRQKMEEERKEG